MALYGHLVTQTPHLRPCASQQRSCRDPYFRIFKETDAASQAPTGLQVGFSDMAELRFGGGRRPAGKPDATLAASAGAPAGRIENQPGTGRRFQQAVTLLDFHHVAARLKTDMGLLFLHKQRTSR